MADAEVPPERLGSQELHKIILDFLDNQTYTDVEFLVQCGEDFVSFPAHRLPCAIFSPVFEDMFYGNAKGYNSPVIINDVTPNVFTVMLKFMYGSVCELTSKQRDVHFLLKLYRAATQYQIEALQCICRNKLATVTPEKHNVFHLLDAATMTNDEGIRRRCRELLETKTAEILANQQDLGDVSHAKMMTVLNLERVSFPSEFELVSWVFAWAANEHLRLKEMQENKTFRNVLDSVLGHIDLTAMNPSDFGRLLSNHPSVFSESEICKIFRNIVDPGCYDLPDWANANINRTYNYRG
ncbi:hypothetical protein JTE90_014412 [Oedothorax gibbosus]|uniref:BTB domain-containing protein n=1 Tax=Oedothorax gibbosus TaxID=931172 RepID=A0AAV6UGR8_9ARAC|nr:hypothetical protein JTE90_014412 [Oedothorax gibbosus]